MTGVFDYEQARHTPGFTDYERGVLEKINREHTSGLALAALVLSLLWIGGIGSFLAVILSSIALDSMKQDKLLRGKGVAVVGLVLGVIGLAVSVALLVTQVLPQGSFYSDFPPMQPMTP